MSCGLAVAAALLLSDPSIATQAAATPAVATPTTLAQEPLYADIVSRSTALRGAVDAWIAAGAAQNDGFVQSAEFVSFRTDAAALSERDMAGHIDLRERGTDGDLRRPASTGRPAAGRRRWVRALRP